MDLNSQKVVVVVVLWLDFDGRSFCQSKDYFASRKKKEPIRMAIGGNSWKSVFPKTRAWEQQEWNKIKIFLKNLREAWRSKACTKKKIL